MHNTRDEAIELKPVRKRRSWLKRLAWAAVLFVVALVSAHGIWGWRNASTLQTQIQAYRDAGELILPEDFNTPPVPDDQNAALVLRKAAKSIDIASEAYTRFDALEYSVRYPLAADELAAYIPYVKENAKALEAPAVAMKRPQIDWGIQYTSPVINSLNTELLSELRLLVILLLADAVVAQYECDYRRAVQRAEEVLYISEAVEQNPLMITHLVAIGHVAVASEIALNASLDLTVAEGAITEGVKKPANDGIAGPPLPIPASRQQVLSLCRKLLDISKYQVNGQKMAVGERMSLVDATQAFASGTLDTSAIGFGSSKPSRFKSNITGYVLKPMAAGDAVIMAQHMTRVRDALASPDLPSYSQAMTNLPYKTDANGKIEPYVLHLFANTILPSTGRVAYQHYLAISNRRMAGTALAIRLYALDHDGQLPARLADLVPEYLPAVPNDALAAGQPIGYVSDPIRPLLYSVGFNGRDDGGYEPPPNATRREHEAKGDEVRHLSHQPRYVSPSESEPEKWMTGPPLPDNWVPTDE